MPDRLPVAHVRSPWFQWGVAALALAVATLATFALEPVRTRTPFMFFYAAIAVAAVLGGPRPAVASIAASLLLVDRLFFSSAASWLQSPDIVNLVGFTLVSGLIAALATRTMSGAARERAQREWCEVTLQSIGDAVIVTDARGRVLAMNAVAEELTGWGRREAHEQPIAKVFEIVNERTRTSVENPIDRVCREGKVVGLANHTVLLARDGRAIPIDDSGAPIWSEDGRVVRVLVFRDISERYETDRQRTLLLESERTLRAEAQAANRAKDEFLAVLSHELRTPLHAILGWAQIVRTEPLTPEVARALEVIDRNARRQAQLVEDMLDVSRIVSGRLSLEFAPVDLRQVVHAALDTLRPMIDAKHLRLEVQGACGTVLGDAHRLQQVVWNLVSNAVKFTPAGGRIEIVMEREGPMCSVTVRDDGAGIAPEFLPRVFERFRQEEGGNTRHFGGLGLGLTIVRHLVEMHGGTASAESEGAGRGASFTVRLPLAKERGESPAEPSRPPTPTPRLAGARILAVDDEADARDLVREMISRAGAEVRVAASADEALAALAAFSADLLVVDVEMPGENGHSLLRRAREAGFHGPAIALTAHSSADDRVRALAAGFLQHVPKPVETAELQAVLASALAAGRGRGDS